MNQKKDPAWFYIFLLIVGSVACYVCYVGVWAITPAGMW